MRDVELKMKERAATVFTKSFMTAENLAPSAAETQSTRVRSFSTPRKSSMENSSVMRRRA